VTPGEIARLLESSGNAYADLLKLLPPAVASWRPAQSEWCVKECVGHVIEAEKRGFAGRVRIILADHEPELQNWDQTGVARERRDHERQPADLLAEFGPLRRASVELVRSLTSDELRRGGKHPKVARLTVDELIHEWVHHDGNHLRQAYANLQAYVWPDMGNAQRFSSG
jgi:DinB family protein